MSGRNKECSTSYSTFSTAGVVGRREWCIGVGSLVSFNLDSQILKGEVLAHDPSTRFIILKMPSSKCHSQWDIHMVNLSAVKEFSVVSDAGGSSSNNNVSSLHCGSSNAGLLSTNNNTTTSSPSSPPSNSLLVIQSGVTSLNGSINKDYQPPPPLPSLNLQKLENRLKDSVEKKKRYLMGYKDGVSPEGQTLFRAISKTLDEVVWDGQNIIVMKMVTISPPYRPENVKSSRHMEAFNHVKKIVEKHVNDMAYVGPKKEAPPSSSSSSFKRSSSSSPASSSSLSNGSSGGGSGGGGGLSR